MSDVTINDNSGEVVITQPIHDMTLAELSEYIVIDNGTDIKTVTVEDTNTVGIIDTVTEVVETKDESVTITEVGIQGPSGANGTGSTITTMPVETPDGSRVVFTTPSAYITGSLQVYLNGLLEGFAHETSATTFTFEEAPHAADTIRITYMTN